MLACTVRRAVDRAVAKYELTHSVRSHIGADDDAFNAIRQREDEEGIRGILLQVPDQAASCSPPGAADSALLDLSTHMQAITSHIDSLFNGSMRIFHGERSC